MTQVTRRRLLQASGAGLAATMVQVQGLHAQPAAGTPKRGGTVTVAIDQAPPSLDAQLTSAQAARDINLHMYETLFARDENATPVPDLADGVHIAKDGLTYTFPLRKGVRFHNGKTMGSADVVASLERCRKVGASPALLGAVESIEASGPLEVTIKLKRLQSSFIDSISSPRAPIAIYPAEEAKKPIKDFSYIGTGPFKYVEYAPDSHVALERFADYTPNMHYKARDGFAGRKVTYIDHAVWRFMPEAGSRVAALETGQIQIVETVNGPQAKQMANKSQYHVLKVLPFLLQVFKYNHAVAPCNDVNFRRAVAACFNCEETMAIAHPDIYDLNGGWVFPNSAYATKAGLDKYNQNNPAKAKELLAKSSYKGEKLTYIADTTNADVATDMAQQLSQIGVQIDLKIADWPTVSKIGLGPTGWHFWTHGFGIEPFEGPATVMGVWVNGLSQQKDDPVIDKLFAELEGELDMAKQKETFARFQQHMWDDAVALQLGDYGLFQVVTSKLQNFTPYRIPRLWGVWLS